MYSWRSKRFAAGLLPLPTAPDTPVVCYVTDRKSLRSIAPIPDVVEKIRAAAQAGADWIQIREKDLRARELLVLVQQAVGIVKSCRSNTLVFVNDRLDVALAAGAAGVHLGGESVPAGDVIRWCRSGNAPTGFRIGVSCHSMQDARAAENAGADYIIFGPIFETPSKRPFGAPQGMARLQEVSSAVHLPVIAIGGVTEENAAACIRGGASGIAAVRLFQEAKDAKTLKEAVAQLQRTA